MTMIIMIWNTFARLSKGGEPIPQEKKIAAQHLVNPRMLNK